MSLKALVISAILVALAGFGAVSLIKAPASPTLGGASSPSVINGCTEINGVTQCYSRVALRTATTTPCAIKSPAATSTLVLGSARLTVSSSTATVWTLAKSTTAFATTTSLGDSAVGASAQAGILATTTPVTDLNDKVVFGPNTYLVLGAAAGITAGDTAGTGFVPAGTCTAEFVVI